MMLTSKILNQFKNLNPILLFLVRKRNTGTYLRGFVFFAVLNLLQLFHLHTLIRPVQYSFAYYANNSKMTKVLREYAKRMSDKETLKGRTFSPIYVEDYEFQYGQVDYKNQVVLDVGADIGSTAYFFVEKGAKLVVAVEGSEQCFRKLKSNADTCTKIFPIQCFIDNSAQIEALISRWKPSIVKMDIEGSEIHLFNVARSIFGSVQEYLIEVHNENLLGRLKECAVHGFEVVAIGPPSPSDTPPPYIVHLRKRTCT